MSDNKGREGRLKVRVRTARGRKTSSTRWLQRQLNDPYVTKAKAEGYRSRAAFKLIEIDDEQHLLKAGQSVLDLGSAPGGWSQVAADRVKSREGRGRVVGIDIQEVAAIPGVEFMQMDFLAHDAPARLEALLGGRVDHVLSDMAPHATGHKATDHLKIMALCEAALDFARHVLKPGGAFLAKVLQGGTQNELLAQMKRDFAVVKHVKPKASRADSSELYVLATGFRGGEDGEAERPEAET